MSKLWYINQAAMLRGAATTLWSLKFDGTSSIVTCGKTNGLDDLADAEFTVEAWVKTVDASAIIIKKGAYATAGWLCSTVAATVRAYILCATTHAFSRISSAVNDDAWHHIVWYFNDGGDRKIYIAVDGVWAASYTTQTAGDGAILTDAALNLIIGENDVGSYGYFAGNLGWIRISNNDRYSHTTNFTSPSRATYPTVDANTLAQWNMSEGTGTGIDNVQGTATRDGIAANCTWEAAPL